MILMLSVPLTAETERRLSELAKDRGLSNAELARDLLAASVEDIDDIALAETRLETREPPLTMDQARKALGLDD